MARPRGRRRDENTRVHRAGNVLRTVLCNDVSIGAVNLADYVCLFGSHSFIVSMTRILDPLLRKYFLLINLLYHYIPDAYKRF